MKIFSLDTIGHLFPLFIQFPRAGSAVFHKGSSNYGWISERPKHTFFGNCKLLEKHMNFHNFLITS